LSDSGTMPRDREASPPVRRWARLADWLWQPIRRLPLRRLPHLFASAAGKWYSDDAPTLGAAIAFYTIFSLAPVLVTVLSIASWLFDGDAARAVIFGEMRGIVGDNGVATLQQMVATATTTPRSWWASILGPALFMFGASAVFVQLQVALNAIWKIDSIAPRGVRRPRHAILQYLGYAMSFLRVRLLGFVLVIGAGFLLTVFLTVNAAVVAVTKSIGDEFLILAEVVWLVQAVLSLMALTGMFAAIYKSLPDAPIDWIDVWVGAAITAVLFVLGKTAVGFYLANASVVTGYGAAGAMIVLLLWVYYCAQVFLYGAEITWLWRAARLGHAPDPVRRAPAPGEPVSGAGCPP
jgi:membrane protein